MRRLADRRALDSRELARASEGALALLGEWCEAGWLHAE
jgi:50S ribosomal protein L16 3-hydroxylase